MSRRYHLSLSRRQPTKTVSGRLTNTDSGHRRTPCQPQLHYGHRRCRCEPRRETRGDLTLIAAASALNGRLELTTTDTTTSYEDFKATATGPGDNVTVTLAADGTYTIPITEQGTWSVTISRADDDNTNFNGLPGEQTGLSTDPGVTTSVADISATELGSISIEVTPSDASVKLCTAVDGCGTTLTPTDGTVQFTALPLAPTPCRFLSMDTRRKPHPRRK